MKAEHKIILYRSLINAIQSLQDCAQFIGKDLSDQRYVDQVKGMVRGIGFTIQELAVSLGEDADKLHGSVAWVYILIMRDFEREHIDMSIGTALGNAKTSYKKAQEESSTEAELCTS